MVQNTERLEKFFEITNEDPDISSKYDGHKIWLAYNYPDSDFGRDPIPLIVMDEEDIEYFRKKYSRILYMYKGEKIRDIEQEMKRLEDKFDIHLRQQR